MKVFICGNGNLSFENYIKYYKYPIIKILHDYNPHFVVCDFRGVDTLTMEVLKCETPNVTVLHLGNRPNYLPDKFRTYVDDWNIIGDFDNVSKRDAMAISLCTHFLAYDFNTDKNRKSGTLRNIESCIKQNKIDLRTIVS